MQQFSHCAYAEGKNQWNFSCVTVTVTAKATGVNVQSPYHNGYNTWKIRHHSLDIVGPFGLSGAEALCRKFCVLWLVSAICQRFYTTSTTVSPVANDDGYQRQRLQCKHKIDSSSIIIESKRERNCLTKFFFLSSSFLLRSNSFKL